MTHKKVLLPAALCCAAMLATASVASAGIVTTPLGGGWQATVVDDASVSFVVDAVGPDYLVIQISKDFTDGPDEFGDFPAKLIDFTQIEEDAVPRIIINDEVITNQTGVSWLDFHWELLDSGNAWFNISESSAFTTDPFVNQTWTGVVGNTAMGLDVDGGVLPDFGSSFFPGGSVDPNDHLVIDINVGTLADPTSFTLKEFPTPEPATMTLLALGGAVLLRRRVR